MVKKIPFCSTMEMVIVYKILGISQLQWTDWSAVYLLSLLSEYANVYLFQMFKKIYECFKTCILGMLCCSRKSTIFSLA